jgi:hypothetical protein
MPSPKPKETVIANKPIVDIGVAANIYQSNRWWPKVMSLILSEERFGDIEIGGIRAVSSAVTDANRNAVIGNNIRRLSLTDSNRKEVVHGFLDGKAEYLFWLDDDTAPPQLSITKLYRSGHELISGLYFSQGDTHEPVAHFKNEIGRYIAIVGYSSGNVMQVDSIGMGCCLIHRSVFERIMEGHELFRRYNGVVVLIQKSQIRGDSEQYERFEPYVENGIYHEPYMKTELQEGERYPFYAFENGRTEDLYFCELADHVGIKPWVDTSVVCEHIKLGTITEADYSAILLKEEGIL